MIICKGCDGEQKDDEAVHGSRYVSQLIFQAAIGARGRLLCMQVHDLLEAEATNRSYIVSIHPRS
jgi:hypothetical protein